MRRLGVKATPDETASIKELATTAQSTPVIAMSVKDGIEGRDWASLAWNRVYEAVNTAAKAHGLPDIEGNYGLDPENGEFLAV